MQDQQSAEVEAVTSRFRDAVQVTPPPDEVDALPLVVSMVDLPDELLEHIFKHVYNCLDPRVAVALSSVCNALRTATRALLEGLRARHEMAAAFCLKLGRRSCKRLREAKYIFSLRGLIPDDLLYLGTLGSLLPALQALELREPSLGDGATRFLSGLEVAGMGVCWTCGGSRALPALRRLEIESMWVGDVFAMTLARILKQGTMPRLRNLRLHSAAIGDAGLVALAPALRRLPELEELDLSSNPFGDEGLAALVALPPRSAGAPPPTTGVLTKLNTLNLQGTQITGAGCATLAAALNSGVLPAIEHRHDICLDEILASAQLGGVFAVREALASRLPHDWAPRWRG